MTADQDAITADKARIKSDRTTFVAALKANVVAARTALKADIDQLKTLKAKLVADRKAGL